MFKHVFFLVILSTITLAAQSATNLRADSFYIQRSLSTYERINFLAFKKHLLIHSDISIPIEYRDTGSFKLYTSKHNRATWYQPKDLPDANVQNGKTGSWTGITLVEADFNGDGLTDLLARTSLRGAKAFIIYGSSGARPERVDYLSGFEISSNTTIKDFDGDGKDEIAISSNGQIHTVYDVSGSSGNLVLTKNTTIDYRQFNLGGYLGYKPKAASLVAPNRLNSSVNYTNGSLSLAISALLPPSHGPIPELSFVNTNSTTLDLLGVGWNIWGNHEITSCASHGSEGIKSTYCKNGQELEKISQSSSYIGTDYYYKPKNSQLNDSTFKKGYLGFSETTSTGTKITYGSQVSGSDVSRFGETFKIKSIRDALGNSVDYKYTEQSQLSGIQYDDVVIAFEYSSKVNNFKNSLVDISPGFIAQQEKVGVVTKITVSKDDNLVSNYYFGYSTKAAIRLQNYQFCGMNSGDESCEPAYQIESIDALGFDSQTFGFSLTAEEFKSGNLFTTAEQHKEIGIVEPIIKILSATSESKVRTKDINLGTSEINQYPGPVTYSHKSTVGSIIPFTQMYYRSKNHYSFLGLITKTSTGACWSTNGRPACNANRTDMGVAITESGDANLSGEREYFGVSGFKDTSTGGIYPISKDIDGDGLDELITAGVGWYSNYYRLYIGISSSNGEHTSIHHSNITDQFYLFYAKPGYKNYNPDLTYWDIKSTPVLDLTGEGNSDIIFRVKGTNKHSGNENYNQFYRLEVNKDNLSINIQNNVTRLVFDTDHTDHTELMFDHPIWMDVNGDDISDMVFVTPDGVKTYITENIMRASDLTNNDVRLFGIVSKQSEINFSPVSIDAEFTNDYFVESGINKSNAVPYDLNGDGLLDLLILNPNKQAMALISNGGGFEFDGELSSALNIRAGNVNQIKITDYDLDGVVEIVERLSNGKTRVLKPKNDIGLVQKVEYDNKDVLIANYDNAASIPAGANSAILPPNRRTAMFSNILTSIDINRGANGWIRSDFTYEDPIAFEKYATQGFKTITEKKYTTNKVSSSHIDTGYVHNERNIYKDTKSTNDRYVEIDKVTSTIKTVSDDDSGSDYTFVRMQTTPVSTIKTGDSGYQYYINYNSFSNYYDSFDGEHILKKSIRVIPDAEGRVSQIISQQGERVILKENTYGNTTLPLFVTQEKTRIRKSLSGAINSCSQDESSDECSESIVKYEAYKIKSGADVPLVKKVTSYLGDSLLSKTSTYKYNETEKYLSSLQAQDNGTQEIRTQVLGIPQSGQPSTIQKGSLAATTYTYNPYGQVLTQVEPNGASLTNTYDGLGRPTSSASNVGASSTISYNSCATVSCPTGGYMYAETQADSGEKARAYYDLNGTEIGSGRTNSDGAWLYSFNKYDIKGRVVKAITNAQSFGSTVGKVFKYRTDNLIAEIKEPKGATDSGTSEKITTFGYDFKNKTSLSDQTLAAKLDLGNSLVKQTTIVEKHAALTVDGLTVPAKENTKVVWSSAATDRVLGHDLDLTLHTGTLYTYDVWGKNSSTKVIGQHGGTSGVLALGLTTQEYISKHDKAGNLVTSDRPGRDPITHAYNAFGELTKTIAADGSFIDMTYDDLGRIETKSYSGIAAANIDAKKYTWNYDATKGLLNSIQNTTTAASPIAVESFTYKTSLPLVDTHSKTINGSLYSKTYTYDSYGRINNETFNDGYGFSHGYTNGQLSSIKDLAGSSIWSLNTIDDQGRPTLKTYFNDLKYHQEFETYSNQLKSRYLKKGTKILDGEELFFDPLDNLAFKAASVGAVNTDNLSMSYDDKNRISSVTDKNNSNQGRVFSFDDFGNFLNKDTVNGKYSYSTYNGSYNSWISGYKLSTSVTNESISYSASTTTVEGAGHITELAGFTLDYNEMGQPISISDASSYNTQFNYGPNDELVSVSYSDGRTLALWGDMQHVTVHKGEAAEESYYRYRKNAAIILKGAVGSQYNGSYVVHVDHLGSVRSIWDSAGTDVDTSWIGNQTFDAYGQPVTVMESVSGLSISDITDAGYTGQMMIKGTSFIHMNARLYDYGSGVFTSTDPLFADMQRAGGLNAYGYVYGNPFSFTDPSGKAGLIALEDVEAGRASVGDLRNQELLENYQANINLDTSGLDFSNVRLTPVRTKPNAWSVISSEGPKWTADVKQQVYYEMVERKTISLMLGAGSRVTGHASAAMLTLSLAQPELAPFLFEPGAILGIASTTMGVTAGAWDAYFYSDSLSATSASVGALGEFAQTGLTSMVPGPVKPVVYTGMEIYQTGFREVFYQMGAW